MSPGTVTPEGYEVRCPRCQVSFAPETRRCLHCGSPTVRPEEARQIRISADEPPPEVGPFGLERPSPPGAEAGGERVETGAGWLSRGLGLLWIALVVAVSLYRACQGDGRP